MLNVASLINVILQQHLLWPCSVTNFILLTSFPSCSLFSIFLCCYGLCLFSSCLSACLLACLPGLTSPKDPEALYSSPSTGGRQLKEDVHYENDDLYENMPSPKLATRYPPKPSSSSTSSSSTSTSHYKTPVSKISSKFLKADTKTKDTAQVTNTLLLRPNLFPVSRLYIHSVIIHHHNSPFLFVMLNDTFWCFFFASLSLCQCLVQLGIF